MFSKSFTEFYLARLCSVWTDDHMRRTVHFLMVLFSIS